MVTFKLQFPAKEIGTWAAKYAYPAGDDLPARIGDAAREAGFLTRDQFIQLAGWKSHRPARHHVRNSADAVTCATRAALLARGDLDPIRALTKLEGVRIPTASALLHFCHTERYPLIDFRVLEALGVPRRSNISLDLWTQYARTCRELADTHNVTLRDLDRAMWAWSDTRSPRRSRCRSVTQRRRYG